MRHPQRRPGAKGGASRPDYATINNHATANHRALIGNAPRVASRVRFAYAALRGHRQRWARIIIPKGAPRSAA